MDYTDKIIDCLQKAGINVPAHIESMDLNDYILDSLEFVSFIVAIEEEFGIEVPEEMLSQEYLTSIESFNNMLVEQLSKKR